MIRIHLEVSLSNLMKKAKASIRQKFNLVATFRFSRFSKADVRAVILKGGGAITGLAVVEALRRWFW
jgi:hypothetical protein